MKKIKKTKQIKDPIRKHKDLKTVQAHIYEAIGGDCLSIQIMDRKTGKIYAGNIFKTFNDFKSWKNRYNEKGEKSK